MSDEWAGEATVRWFGESWHAPVCAPALHIETPVYQECIGHEHMHATRSPWIEAGDQGVTMPYVGPHGFQRVAYHLDCWLHEVGADRLRRERV